MHQSLSPFAKMVFALITFQLDIWAGIMKRKLHVMQINTMGTCQRIHHSMHMFEMFVSIAESYWWLAMSQAALNMFKHTEVQSVAGSNLTQIDYCLGGSHSHLKITQSNNGVACIRVRHLHCIWSFLWRWCRSLTQLFISKGWGAYSLPKCG